MPVILLGGGEHARVVAEACDVLEVLDAAGEARIPALREQHPAVHFHIAIGDNHLRLRLAARLDLPWATIIHPRACVSPSAHLMPGAFVGALAVVQAGARIGAHAILNTGAIIEHDCGIEAGVHLAPGAVLGGGVQVGRAAFVGLGARIRDHRRIGPDAIVGMGAVVVADVPPGATVVGIPARVRP